MKVRIFCPPSWTLCSVLQTGEFKFLATFPNVYKERPIPHYHLMVLLRSLLLLSNTSALSAQVSTPGARGVSLTTQIYFRDRVPRDYTSYVRTRGAQFGRVSLLPPGAEPGLPRGGRRVTFNVRLDV